jgi:hypothetical protein
MDTGELWPFLRSLLSRGGDIWIDHQQKSYEEYSARLDVAAREQVPKLMQLLSGKIKAPPSETDKPPMTSADVLRVFAPLPPDEAAALREYGIDRSADETGERCNCGAYEWPPGTARIEDSLGFTHRRHVSCDTPALKAREQP